MQSTNGTKHERNEGPGMVRVLNEQLILEAILDGEGSRPQIARKTGLSLPTVMSVVDSLEAIGLVHQQGALSGSLGRPAALYSLNPQAGYVFAVDLGGTKVEAGIADLAGNVVVQVIEATAKGDAQVTVQQLTDLHGKLLAQSGFDPTALGAACIGAPGVWDADTDRLDAAFNLPHLADIPIHATIQDALGIPLAIENDVNLAAIGEAAQGQAQGHDTFVAISIGTGIGMGIVINGAIYRGHSGAAGEIGLLPVGPNPFDPAMHPNGPFETMASGPSLQAQLNRRLQGDDSSTLAPGATIEQIVAAANAGDEMARTLLDEEARTIAIGIAAVVAVLDPSLVILGGGVGANDLLADPIRSYAKQLITWMPPIEVSTLGNDAAFYGAIAHGLPIARRRILLTTRNNR